LISEFFFFSTGDRQHYFLILIQNIFYHKSIFRNYTYPTNHKKPISCTFRNYTYPTNQKRPGTPAESTKFGDDVTDNVVYAHICYDLRDIDSCVSNVRFESFFKVCISVVPFRAPFMFDDFFACKIYRFWLRLVHC